MAFSTAQYDHFLGRSLFTNGIKTGFILNYCVENAALIDCSHKIRSSERFLLVFEANPDFLLNAER